MAKRQDINKWTPTPQSSNVAGFGYDSKSRTLTVTFKSGSSYTYAGVPPEKARQFNKAKSKGKFVNNNLRDNYPTAKVEDSE